MTWREVLKSKPACLIYGHDGFDLDVLLNVRSLYTDLGFKVFFSNTLQPASLLVVIRPPDVHLPVSSYQSVHVYDYVANDFPMLIESLKTHRDVWILSSSELRRDDLRKDCPALEDRIVFQFPPVDVRLWMSSLKPVEYEFVHIGNYKPYYSDNSDQYAGQLLGLVSEGTVAVWGAGWNEPLEAKSSRGSLRVHEVSGIYSSARHGVGMMYPNQRSLALSGRFWHGPLNGCPILSEPNVFCGVIPGVVEWNFDRKTIENAAITSRHDLVQAAASYWSGKYGDLLAHWTLVAHAEQYEVKRRYLLRRMVLTANNTVRRFKQKYA